MPNFIVYILSCIPKCDTLFAIHSGYNTLTLTWDKDMIRHIHGTQQIPKLGCRVTVIVQIPMHVSIYNAHQNLFAIRSRGKNKNQISTRRF